MREKTLFEWKDRLQAFPDVGSFGWVVTCIIGILLPKVLAGLAIAGALRIAWWFIKGVLFR